MAIVRGIDCDEDSLSSPKTCRRVSIAILQYEEQYCVTFRIGFRFCVGYVATHLCRLI